MVKSYSYFTFRDKLYSKIILRTLFLPRFMVIIGQPIYAVAFIMQWGKWNITLRCD